MRIRSLLLPPESALEHAVQIFYDSSEGSYILYEPEQYVTRSSVEFKRDMLMEQKYILVMDIHRTGFQALSLN